MSPGSPNHDVAPDRAAILVSRATTPLQAARQVNAVVRRKEETMIVQTTWSFAQPPETIWPLLCNSRMEPVHSPLFGLGLPQPQQCRLPDGHGGVGSTRQCISDRGVVEQTILVWDEPHHLAFSMDRSDLYFRSCVISIVDDFELVRTPSGATRATRATRTTSVQVVGWFRWFKQLALWFGLKKIHRFVFGNWQRLAAAAVLPVPNPNFESTP